jgi:hypothetical protein
MKIKSLLFLALTSLTIMNSFAGIMDVPLTAEEQALFDKGATMEMYEPSKHSGHQIVIIDIVPRDRNRPKNSKPQRVLALIFGMEDAGPARSEGESMAAFNYSPSMAQQFLFAEGWDKYHDRYFTRAYVQEGMDAYSKARHQ